MVSDVPLDHFTLKEDEFRAFENAHLFVSYGNPNKSLGYMQQIVLHSTVTPSTGFACFSLRKPLVRALEQSFKLVQLIREFRMNSTESGRTGQNFGDLCFQVEDRAIFEDGAGDTIYNALPTFGCLLLAPSLLWDSVEQMRLQQAAVFTRLKQASVGNLRDLFFGFMWKMTGISRYPVCARETTISFAITLVLRDYHPQFVNELRSHLLTHFAPKQFVMNVSADSDSPLQASGPTDSIPLTQVTQDSSLGSPLTQASWTRADGPNTIRHVYLVWYRMRSYLSDYAPLILIYVVLLLYIYFSVRKLEMVKSKLGLAFSACFTVVASLFMSIGLCINIGLMVPTLNGSEIFPYLVVLIGFENVIILTKSVVATPIDLPVKYRIAQGLSKESWPLTKHYVTQFILLGLGFFTFHPTMQEFCLFAVVGVTTDFFLQLFFFVSVLSIDIRRMELSDLNTQYPNSSLVRDPQLLFASNLMEKSSVEQLTPITVVRSGPTFSSTALTSTTPWPVVVACLTKLNLYWISLCTRVRGLIFACRARVKPSFHRGHKRKVSAAEAAAFLASDDRPAANFPRRLFILRMWAKHRLIQRFIVVFMSLWLLIFLVYAVDISQLLPTALKSVVSSRNVEPSLNAIGSLKHDFVQEEANSDVDYKLHGVVVQSEQVSTTRTTTAVPKVVTTAPSKNLISESDSHEPFNLKTDILNRFSEFPLAHVLRHPTEATWNQLLLWNYLAFYHWPLLAKHYNLSLAGYHSVLLEPVHLQYHIEVESIPNTGNVLYNNEESNDPVKHSYWQWQPSSNFRLPEFWFPEKYSSHSNMESDNKSKPDSNPLTVFAEELMHLFRQSKRGSTADISPGGLAGWTARLSLTASMLGTTVLCCSIVLMATCLSMIFFQELQSKSSAVVKREPVVRVLPLTITLSTSNDRPIDTDSEPDSILLPEWTIACGKLPYQTEDGSSKVEGIVAAYCCVPSSGSASPTSSLCSTIRLWSTDSGLPLSSIQRFSNDTLPIRRATAFFLRRPCRRRSTVWSMTFISDGRLLVGCNDGIIEIWNCKTNELENLLAIAYPKPDCVTSQPESVIAKTPVQTEEVISAIQDSFQSGGVTTFKVTGAQSFLTGTSRGYIALFNLGCHNRLSSASQIPILPARLWHPHTKPVTHLSCAFLGSEPSVNELEPPERNLLILSASEDSHVVFTVCNMQEPLHRLSLDSSAIIGFDFNPMVVAVSHVSGSLYVIRFALDETDNLPTPPDGKWTIPDCPTAFRIDVLQQILLATGPHASNKCSLNTTAKHVQSHVGSVGLKLCAAAQLQKSTMSISTSQLLSDFRLVTCELDGTVSVWNLRPPRLVRSFRLNLSTLSPADPMTTVDGRIVFGDQGYLRVVNPWTAKYERSVQLLPPSTTLFRNTNSVSSDLLCAVLRKWSKELVPIGVAGPCYESTEPVHFISSGACRDGVLDQPHGSSIPTGECSPSVPRSSLTGGSVMVSLADNGRTLVIVPLTTMRPN